MKSIFWISKNLKRLDNRNKKVIWKENFVKTHTPHQVYDGFVILITKRLNRKLQNLNKRLDWVKRKNFVHRIKIIKKKIQNIQEKIVQLKKQEPRQILNTFVSMRLLELQKKIAWIEDKASHKNKKYDIPTIKLTKMFFQKAIFLFTQKKNHLTKRYWRISKKLDDKSLKQVRVEILKARLSKVQKLLKFVDNILQNMNAKLKFIETHNDQEIYDKFIAIMKERFTSIKAQILKKLENKGKLMPYKVRQMLEEKLKNIDKKLDYFKNSDPEKSLRDVMMMRWSN